MGARPRALAGASALLAAAVVLALAAGGSGAQSSSKLNRQQLRGIITAFAHSNGEPSPRGLKAVETDRLSALRVVAPGDNVATDAQDVYAMTATGKFKGYRAHTPKGEDPPSGDYLTMVVDATTGDVLDWGLDTSPPDLESLGGTTDLGQ